MEQDSTGTEPTQGQSGPGPKDGPAVGSGHLEQQSRWLKVEQPEETGIRPGEVPIPAGMEEEIVKVFDCDLGTVIKYMEKPKDAMLMTL